MLQEAMTSLWELFLALDELRRMKINLYDEIVAMDDFVAYYSRRLVWVADFKL